MARIFHELCDESSRKINLLKVMAVVRSADDKEQGGDIVVVFMPRTRRCNQQTQARTSWIE